MGLMTAEQKAAVPGGHWSVLSAAGKVVAECASEVEANRECQQLSRHLPQYGPYIVARGVKAEPEQQPKEPKNVGTISTVAAEPEQQQWSNLLKRTRYKKDKEDKEDKEQKMQKEGLPQ